MAEIKACKSKATKLVYFSKGTKWQPLTCSVTCEYADGLFKVIEMVWLAEGTPCADSGLSPKGTCNFRGQCVAKKG